jgi:DNA-binding MarR family transcriptional regulator
MHNTDKELEILQHIQHEKDVHQRDLARIVGLSLGMTNAIVKRLAQKGFLLIRKINNRNIRYAVTAEGIDEIARRSYRYFKRTIKNVVYYKDAVEALIREAGKGGYSRIVLVGPSDLDFIVEHCCRNHGLVLERWNDGSALPSDADVFLVFSENYEGQDGRGASAGRLKDLITAV